MNTGKAALLEGVQEIRKELDRLLEGIDYCFDWKPNDGEWSGREVAYHLVDTPKGGIHTALQGLLDGTIQELKIVADITNVDVERLGKDIAGVREDLEAVLSGLEKMLTSANDEELETRKVPVSIQRSTGTDINEWTVEYLARRSITSHWPNHLRQLAELREALGID